VTNFNRISDKYALAIFLLAKEKKVLDKVGADLLFLRELLQDVSEFSFVLSSPMVSDEDKKNLIDLLFSKFKAHEYVVRFVLMVLENNRANILEDILSKFRKIWVKFKGEISMELISAVDIKDDQRESLEAEFRKLFNTNIYVEYMVDEAILGGLILKIDSKMFDASLASRIASISKCMKSTLLY